MTSSTESKYDDTKTESLEFKQRLFVFCCLGQLFLTNNNTIIQLLQSKITITIIDLVLEIRIHSQNPFHLISNHVLLIR